MTPARKLAVVFGTLWILFGVYNSLTEDGTKAVGGIVLTLVIAGVWFYFTGVIKELKEK